MTGADEVRFDRMRPAQVVARRQACNLAYLPVSTLEWHGPHMPFGTDSITNAYLAEEAARQFGGVAFPAMYYSDVRHSIDAMDPREANEEDGRSQWRGILERCGRCVEQFMRDP